MSSTLFSNLALSQVPAGSITSLDENSIQARACKLWYPEVIRELLAKGQWRFAMTREALAVKTNDRPGQWAQAYAVPANLAIPAMVLDSGGGGPHQFEYTATTIYAQVPDASLDYVTGADTTSGYDGLFRSAVVALLASRICVPVTKNFKREAELIKAAEVAVDRALAANHNLNPQGNTYMDHVPDVLLARIGDVLPERRYPDWQTAGLTLGVTGL